MVNLPGGWPLMKPLLKVPLSPHLTHIHGCSLEIEPAKEGVKWSPPPIGGYGGPPPGNFETFNSIWCHNICVIL